MTDQQTTAAGWMIVIALLFGLMQWTGCNISPGDESGLDCDAHEECPVDEACLEGICATAPDAGDPCPDSHEGDQFEDLTCLDGEWHEGTGPPEIRKVTARPPTVAPGGTTELEVDVDAPAFEELDYAWEAPEDWTLLEDDAPVVDLDTKARPGETATIEVVVTDSADQTAEGDVEVSTHQVDGPEIQSIEAEPKTAIPGRLQTVTAEADHPQDHELDYQWELPEDWEIEEDLEGDTIEIRAPDEHDRSGDVDLTVVDEFDQKISTTVNVQTEALFCGGEGTETEPWEVCSATFVNRIGFYDEYLGDHFVLTNDVDMHDLEEDELYLIGDDTDPFAGTFDGAGHVVENFEVDESGAEIGLFGRTAEGAEIQDLTLRDAEVTGDDHIGGVVGRHEGTLEDVTISATASGETNVGGLVGRNLGSVSRSSADAQVDGDDAAGGLVGHNLGELDEVAADGDITVENDVGGLVGRNEGTVADAYSTAEVEGDDSVGGLVGTNETSGTIDNTYAAGLILGPSDRGGLVGDNLAEDAAVQNSYWDVETTGVADGNLGTGLETDQFGSHASFAETWTFYPDDEFTWLIGEAPDDQLRPVLEWQQPCDDGDDCSSGGCDQDIERCVQCIVSSDADDGFGGGDGSADDPWRICTEQHLEKVAEQDKLTDHFRVFDDIELTSSWIDADYIATDSEDQFEGTFDGNGYSITNLDLATDTQQSSFGLFGTVGTDGEIRNLILQSPEVVGSADEAGTLAGTNEGTIENCHAESVDIDATEVVGGLVGANNGSIESSTATGTVEASLLSSSEESAVAGGLVGADGSGTIRNSSADVDVTTEGAAQGVGGGLAGSLTSSMLEDSSASGSVFAEGDLRAHAGGLVGLVDPGGDVSSGSTIRTSFATGPSSADVPGADPDGSPFAVIAAAGGLVGSIGSFNDVTTEIEDTYALGEATASVVSEVAPDDSSTVWAPVGGLVGLSIVAGSQAVELRRSYSIGATHQSVMYPGSDSEGAGDAVVGRVSDVGGSIAMTSLYYAEETGDSTTDAVGLTPGEFADQSTFEDVWDFTDVWTMGTTPPPDDQTRPVLQWQD